MRREELRPAGATAAFDEDAAEAASDLLGVYAGLAERGAHLLGDLLAGAPWVTGDPMLGAEHTARLLMGIKLDTGHPDIDRMIVSVVRLCGAAIRRVLAKRDALLATREPRDVLEDRSLEVLSEASLDIDSEIARALD